MDPDIARGPRVAIVGAGPSGFYATAQLLAQKDPVFRVDLFDRLPTPYGLVRAGVAPDHQKIKSVTRAFDATARHERFRFFGHVEVGSAISREEMLERYHAVIYAFGTAADRRLEIPGEELDGSHAATDVVSWYNGHPDHCALAPDLGARRAVVVGAGNVALDVARMLALGADELRCTDVADHALAALTASSVEDITVLARRGPLQAAFTNPELLEIGTLSRADVEVVDGHLDPLSAAALEHADRTRQRNAEIIADYAQRERTGKPVVIRFRFLASPTALLGDASGHVRAVRIERNEIVRRDDGVLGARATGRFEDLPAELVVRAVGYAGRPLDGVPFDASRGTIHNAGGRVTDADGTVLHGEYVTGWIKRGPSGVIGTNKKDSQATVACLVEDAIAGRLATPDRDDIEVLLRERSEHCVRWGGWQAIDALERGAGEPLGRPRVKLTEWDRLRQAARSAV